jgi:hypothetical protein
LPTSTSSKSTTKSPAIMAPKHNLAVKSETEQTSDELKSSRI